MADDPEVARPSSYVTSLDLSLLSTQRSTSKKDLRLEEEQSEGSCFWVEKEERKDDTKDEKKQANEREDTEKYDENGEEIDGEENKKRNGDTYDRIHIIKDDERNRETNTFISGKLSQSQNSAVTDTSSDDDSISISSLDSSISEIQHCDPSSSTSSSSSSCENFEGHMSPDSEEEYHSISRTLEHYRPRVSHRRRRRRRLHKMKSNSRSTSSSASNSRSTSRSSTISSSSLNSDCSCVSCSSDAQDQSPKFFGKEVGPPGGERTIYRRAIIWLESIKYLWGILIYGLLSLSILYVGVSIWTVHNLQTDYSYEMLNWSVPFLVVTSVIVIAWRGTWYILLYKGYGEGDHIQERRSFIEFAQAKKLVYTIRGAVYAPVRPDPVDNTKSWTYEIVTYESEYDSDLYFASDLEPDGQYRRNLTPWQEVEEEEKRARRNIYTKEAWRRDVPVLWWEVWNQPRRDF